MSVSSLGPQPYTNLTEMNNLLEDGDVLALVALNGKFVSCDPSNRLVAVVADAAKEDCKLTAKKDGSSDPFKIQSDNGKYVIVGADDYLCATGGADDAVLLTVSVSMRSKIHLSTNAGMYIRLDSDNHLRADAVDYLSAETVFEIAFQYTPPQSLEQFRAAEVLSECDKALVSFIWKLVPGFFLAIGLGSYISIGEALFGVLNLIKSNPAACAALMKFKDAIISSEENIKAVIAGGLDVITVLFKEGLLWTVFKWVLKAGVWWTITKAIAKIIEVLFIPELEAAELLASFTIWAIQTIQSGLGVAQACN